MIEEALEQLNPQPRIQATSSRPYTMHTQLRQASINSAHAHRTRQHRAHRPARPQIIPDLEDLQLRATLVGDALQESRADAIGRGVAVGIGLNGHAGVEARRMVLEVGVEEVGVDGVGDVGADEEAVGVHLGGLVGAAAVTVGGEGFAYAFERAGEEV